MSRTTEVSNELLIEIRNELVTGGNQNVTSQDIQTILKEKHGLTLDDSTIRGRFIVMGQPIGKAPAPKPVEEPKKEELKKVKLQVRNYTVEEIMKRYIPSEKKFKSYVKRPVDDRLAHHYEAGKSPITQGKQGTGKTSGHEFYAYSAGLPFFLFSCHADMKLHKLFGDKTIENGSIKFKEGEFVKAIQSPSVILFDEINAVDPANTFDFHAMLQNRELFVKDADNGNGKWYKLHPDCKIGFSQNPKSSKYVGGNVKPSNFLGRCTFITYPEFDKRQLEKALKARHPKLNDEDMKKYIIFYDAVCKAIDKAELPIDISIRQLFNLVDFVESGMDLKHAIEDSIICMLDAISQPAAKEAIFRLAQATWQELLRKGQEVDENAKQQIDLNQYSSIWKLTFRKSRS